MATTIQPENTEKKSLNFIEQKIENDLAEGKNHGKVQTRFPPEPNGYLHIGHAKAIALDFGVAKKYGGICNLRFDDTNPQKEDTEYIDSIEQDIKWLGYEWANVYYASDYFQQLWDFAIWLIKQGSTSRGQKLLPNRKEQQLAQVLTAPIATDLSKRTYVFSNI